MIRRTKRIVKAFDFPKTMEYLKALIARLKYANIVLKLNLYLCWLWVKQTAYFVLGLIPKQKRLESFNSELEEKNGMEEPVDTEN